MDEIGASVNHQVTQISDEELIDTDADGVTKTEDDRKVEGSIEKIEKAYSTFFKIWNTTMIPKLMMLDLYKSDEKLFDTKHLMVEDIPYFKMDESEVFYELTVDKVTDLIVGEDGAVRKVILKFLNANKKEPWFSDRAERSLVKLFNIEISTCLDVMNIVEKVVDAQKKETEVEGELVNEVKHNVAISQKKLQHGEVVRHRTDVRVARKKMINPCKTCCCVLNCQVTEHGPKAVPVVVNHYSCNKEQLFVNILDRSVSRYAGRQKGMKVS